MSYEYSEDGLVEAATQEVLEQLGWRVVTAWRKETFGPNGLLGRENKGEVVLRRHLRAALVRLNPGLPETAYTHALEALIAPVANATLGQINHAKHKLLTQGVEVRFQDAAGELTVKRLRVFDFDVPLNNEFLAVRQFEVAGELYNRRPDVVGFVNGVPLVFFELKAHHQDLEHAFTDNLTDYKDTIAQVFAHNAFIVLSNGTDARVGTVTSKYKYFLDWKRITEDEEGCVSLETMLHGVCAPERLLDIFENFLLFDGVDADVAKIMAKNHQYIGVNKVVEQARDIEDLKGKLGVFWHTQGSGKSYSMVFLCQKILRKYGGGYTFLIVVDRTELENQLYDTFTGVGAVTEENVRARSRVHLRELLAGNHRYVFSLIHKFGIDPKLESEYPLLTTRSNIIVISDEAHRTQGGKFAQNMRFQGLPNASYLGFTGTPIIKNELELTKNIFGEYVSVYDFKRAIGDGATLPLRYLNRGEKLGIENPDLDAAMADIIDAEDLDEDQRAKLQREFAREYPILTSQKRLDAIAKDLVWHFNDRGYQGKAMFVALDKPTAVRMYDLVMHYWPMYVAELKERIATADDEQEAVQLRHHLQRVQQTEVCVVVSSEQNEVEKFRKMNLDIEPHRRKVVERDLEVEFKDEDNPFRLAIVCAMWITGFDAPCVSTVYLDKPMRGHTLMQTIARANRVYDDEKENGLIVDYGNVYKNLEAAYSVYGEASTGDGDNGETGKPTDKLDELLPEFLGALEATRGYLKGLGFDLDALIDCISPMQKLGLIKQAMNAVKLNETTRTQFEFQARDVFRKYKALYPEACVKPYVKAYNAIDAIYSQLNQNVKAADITSVMMRLQQEVDMSVVIDGSVAPEDVWIDLSLLDFDKLRAAFAKSEQKQAVVYDLQGAIEQRLDQMMQENPLRLEFYKRYQEIIAKYNEGKDASVVQKTFDELQDFIKDLSIEQQRAMKEGLDEETLALFDLLKKPELTAKEIESVKKVAVDTLAVLKKQFLEIARWRESIQVAAQVRTALVDKLPWLPTDFYTAEEVDMKSIEVYQHVYSHYGSENVRNGYQA